MRSSPYGTSNGTRASVRSFLRAHNSLRNGRLRLQEAARNFVGRQSAEEAQRERHARLGRQDRMAGGENQPQQIVADIVVERGIDIGRLRPDRFRVRGRSLHAFVRASFLRRRLSIARCLAVAISQAAGFSGMPVSGQRSSAATSASCASSSAWPMSRVTRVSEAISFADSILKTARMARWVSVAVTATDHTILSLPVQRAPGAPPCYLRFLSICAAGARPVHAFPA